jgi:hypothetical protein
LGRGRENINRNGQKINAAMNHDVRGTGGIVDKSAGLMPLQAGSDDPRQ